MIDYTLPISIPRRIAVCPICGGSLIIDDIDETYENRLPTETGFSFSCEHEPDIGDDRWDEWHRWHYRMPYVD